MKTVGGGACGRVAAVFFGRRRIYTRTMNRDNRMRLMGVAMVALC